MISPVVPVAKLSEAVLDEVEASPRGSSPTQAIIPLSLTCCGSPTRTAWTLGSGHRGSRSSHPSPGAGRAVLLK